MKKIFNILFFVFIFGLATASAQYVAEKHYLTPCLGFYWHGSTPEFGVNYEYSLGKDLHNIGIGGILRYLSYSEDFFGGKWKYSTLYIGAQGNYHIKLDNSKLDPFFGLTLGFRSYSTSWEWSGYNYGYHSEASGGTSGLFLAAHATFRYWISPNLGVSGRLNFGNADFGAIDFGVDFKL